MKPDRRGILLITAVLALSAILGGIYGPSVRATASGANDLQGSIREFSRVLAIVQQNYADPVDTDRVVYNGAIPGMLRVLDPHSSFFDPRQFNLLKEDQRGRYYGVGMQVAPRDGRTVVLAPFVGSPAYKAGIRPGDVILKVDDKSTEGLTTTEVADMLKGRKGTVVRITIGREGYDDPLEFTVTRDEIPRHGIDNVMAIRPGIGYIRVVGFNETTDRELTQALDDLDVRSLRGLIVDLRGNPGGLLNEGVAVADMFLQKNQLIVSHRGRASQERRYYALRGNEGVEVPLVVLINGGSASASEIVAGAIQDHDRGLVVGEQSFGKGLVQTVIQLSNNTGLALTTARYYTPSGRLIQRDYKTMSLWDYAYNRKSPEKPSEIKLTASGRQVYGGGGIAPDVVVATPKYNHFQETLLRRDVLYPFEIGVGGFTKYYLGRRPAITKNFVVDDAVLQELRNYLNKQGVPYTEQDIKDNLDWLKWRIKREVFVSEFGLSEAWRVQIEGDLQVQKAIEMIPQARALYENAKKVIAQRSASQNPAR
jgi:carboxyl-terminal processing protease